MPSRNSTIIAATARALALNSQRRRSRVRFRHAMNRAVATRPVAPPWSMVVGGICCSLLGGQRLRLLWRRCRHVPKHLYPTGAQKAHQEQRGGAEKRDIDKRV